MGSTGGRLCLRARVFVESVLKLRAHVGLDEVAR
jgi:hypothetical protein